MSTSATERPLVMRAPGDVMAHLYGKGDVLASVQPAPQGLLAWSCDDLTGTYPRRSGLAASPEVAWLECNTAAGEMVRGLRGDPS